MTKRSQQDFRNIISKLRAMNIEQRQQYLQLLKAWSMNEFGKAKMPRIRKPNGLKVVSLFSGCGGLDLGFAIQGCDVIFANEWDASACFTYAVNFSRLGLDISHLHEGDIWQANMIEAIASDADILIGGFPCQAFSMAGSRNGFEEENDAKGKLIFRVIEILRDKQPKLFVLENVKGILSCKTTLANTSPAILVLLHKYLPETYFNKIKQNQEISLHLIILEMLKFAGYDIHIELVKCEEYGMSQTRHRVLYLGSRIDLKIDPKLLIPNNPQINRILGVRRVLSKPHIKSNVSLNLLEEIVLSVLMPGESYKDLAFWNWHKCIERIKTIDTGLKFKLYYQELKWRKSFYNLLVEAKLTNSNPNLKITLDALQQSIDNFKVSAVLFPVDEIDEYLIGQAIWDECHDIKTSLNFKFNARYRVLASNPIGTIDTQNNKYIHPELNRHLTVQEMAELQTFDTRWFVFPVSKNQAQKQIGNSVPPRISEFIAKSCIYVLKKEIFYVCKSA